MVNETSYANELHRLIEERQATMSACFSTNCADTLEELQAYSERCRVLAQGNLLLANLSGMPTDLDRHDRGWLEPSQQDTGEMTVEQLRERLDRL